MRVGISAEFIATRPGGVATATRNLLWGLSRLPGDSADRFYGYVASPRALPRVPRAGRVRARLVRPYAAAVRVPFTLPFELLRHPVDVLHAHNWAPPWVPCPMVTTIYDLSWETDPHLYPALLRWRLSRLVRFTAQRSKRIIAPSAHSARDIARIYDIPADRIRVIKCAADPDIAHVTDPERLARVCLSYGIRRPFVLYLGSLEPRKNVEQLIRGYAVLRASEPVDHQLVVAGIPLRLSQAIYDLPRQLGIAEHVIFTGKLPESDIAPLYSAADAFAYLACHEGFGYPPIEAMACETPVLAANRGSLPEILGDAAVFVDPFDAEQVAQGLSQLLSDSALRERLRLRGLDQAALYRRDVIAHQVVQVYEECLKETR